jgi:hypothetical protein
MTDCPAARAGFRLRLGAGHAGPQAVRAEQLVRIAAEASGDPVDRLLAGDLLDQEIGGALHFLQLRSIEFDRRAISHGNHLLARQALSVQVD